VNTKSRATKTRAHELAEDAPASDVIDVKAAIQAMQTQLADLRKLVQAAKTPGSAAGMKYRHD